MSAVRLLGAPLMRGFVRRPSSTHGIREGRLATATVLLVVAALAAGCGNPSPSSQANQSGAPAASLEPGGSPGASPGASTTPGDPAAWTTGVEIPPRAPVATFEATAASVAGVLTDTAFRLTPLDGSDPLELADRLTSEPAVEVVVAASGGSALVTPVAPLRQGQGYRFSLAAPDGTLQGTWAVQAIAPLAVVATTPGTESTAVPRNTGIEITFNQYGVALADAERFLRIQPAVAGHLEQAGRTIAFVPDSPLAKGTLYTVTVRHGLPLAGTPMTLPQDVVVRFETAGGDPPSVRVIPSGRLWEVRPTELATIPVRVERWWPEDDVEQAEIPMPKRVAVTVHRLASIEAAVTAWKAIDGAPDWTQLTGAAPVATAGLPVALDRTLPLRRYAEDNDSSAFVRLPGRLRAGWYVITITHGKIAQQLVLQVTDLAVYTVVTQTRTLAWVNDLQTGRPVRGATAAVAGKRLGTTGSDGLVVARTPASVARGDADARGSVLVVRKGGRAVFVPAGRSLCEKCGDVEGGSPWWLVFGPDRYEFRPTDTINAWGMLRDRDSGNVPDRVDVVLSAWNSASGAATEIASHTAVPDRNGAFMVQLPVTDLPYGDYTLELRTGGRTVADRGISVSVIEKPAWTLHLGTSRHAIVAGSSVVVTAGAKFFEGTPVAGAHLVMDSGDERTTSLVTGLDGSASAKVTLSSSADEDDPSQWDTAEITARSGLPEEGEISGTTAVAVFEADVILRDEATIDGTRLVASGTLHDVAFDRFETTGSTWLGEVDPYGPVHPGTSVRLTVIEEIFSRHKTGTEYDFITKRTVPVYEETSRTVALGTKTVTTDSKGRYRATWDVVGGNRQYRVTASAADDAGRRTTTRTWAESRVITSTVSMAPSIEGAAREDGWSIGERVSLTFSGGRGAGDPGTYLWTTTQAGLRSWTLTSKPRWSTTFRGSDVTGYTVQAVRFNGKSYEPADSEVWIEYRKADRALTIAVTPDRARYAPGDRATLAIRTTDAAGKPVAASVYVGVIDQKLVAMGLAEEGSPLDSLYEGVGSGLIGIAWTHRDPGPDAGSEGGDTTGGGSAERTDFRDWLVAKLVRTGSDGRASLSFDLSDDLTSWHAFASGVSRSLLAGKGEAMLPVSLPFFAELTVAETYLAADRPVVLVRAYGDALATDDAVTFTVSSETLPMAPVVVRGTAFTPAEVPLPALTLGTHRLRVEAVTGAGDAARRDVLVRTFSVISSRTSQASVTSVALAESMAVQASSAGLTTLVLGDAGRGRVIPVLTELAEGDLLRGDRALAAGIATRVLRDTFGIEPTGPALEADLTRFQPETAYSLFPYGSDELELSALAALSGDPRIRNLDEYFGELVPTSREERIWGLVGRAATGAPVLAEVAALAALGDRTLDETVALALAALAAGDETTADRLLREVLRESGERQGQWVRVISPAGDDPSIVLTARLAIVAAWLGQPVAAEMDAWLEAHPPKTTLVDLERALAAQGWVRRLPASNAVAALTVDGTRSEVRIDASQPATVVLTPAQASGARLEPVSGSVVVTTRGDQPLDPTSLTAPKGQTIRRTVTPAGTVGLSDAVIVTVEVRLGAQPETTCWAVTELVPSGLVPVTHGAWEDDEGDGEGEDGTTPTAIIEAPWRVTGQRVDFCLEADPKIAVHDLRYVARVVTPGTYRWEETVMQSVRDPSVGSVLPASSITIGGSQ